MQLQWNKYSDSKPVKAGVYLIVNETIDPPLRASSYYDSVHGWTGIGHTLEKVIDRWAEFPITSEFENHVQLQGCSYRHQ